MPQSFSVFRVLLEGEHGSHGYFVNMQVACDTPDEAERLARAKAREIGLNIVGIEEVVQLEGTETLATPQVTFVSGRSFFDKGH